MLEKFKAIRVHSWYYTLFVPLHPIDAAKMMSPALVIGGLLAIIMNDLGVLMLALGLGYLCIMLMGRVFARYQVAVHRDNDLRYIIELLDQTASLERDGVELHWQRRTPPMLRSIADEMTITFENSNWIVRGRKHDILSLVAALNARELR